MTTLEHKGYQGSVEVDLETGVLFGKILFVTDLVTYEAKSVPALKKEFQVAVEDYLATCQQLGRNPQQPCSGVFNVRVGPTLHRAASIRAGQDGVKLNAVMVSALEQSLSATTIRHAHTHDHNVTVRIVSLSDVRRIGSASYSTDQLLTPHFGMNTNVTH